ncbi:hypothetical protein SCALM49S_08088 [Streptomyces californicus]
MRASAIVQDLHIEGQDAAAPALLVEDGTAELRDLRIVTRSAAGIEVRGAAARRDEYGRPGPARYPEDLPELSS